MGEYTYDYADQAPANGANGHNNKLRDVVDFPADTPVQLALKYAKPKTIQTQRGLRYMLTTSHNTVAFLDATAALQIEKLNLKPGEIFWIIRKSGDLGGWDVYLDPSTEKTRESSRASVSAPAPVKAAIQPPIVNTRNGNTSVKSEKAPGPSIHQGWAQFLLSETNALVDVYAAALAYADKHGSRVKPEDVRTFVVTAFIQHAKGPYVA